ncbi:MAG: hypothetical protein LQ342_001973 [Letrouitia transgressa]|nr:MAG: hypothetical protein LQ342_001973 [Letrouitia transgressa]
MATDYSKKKNAELEELLKARSLPHTGKKAELIARLQQSDKEAAAAPASKPSIPAEDEIDWEDDNLPLETAASIPPNSASVPAAATAIAAGGQGQVTNPAAVPNQVPTAEPFESNDIAVNPPGASTDNLPTATTKGAAADAPKASATGTKPTEAGKPPPEDFSAHLPSTSIEDELEKRKRRAARWGTVVSSAESDTAKVASEDAIKALERAKKFGTVDASKGPVKGLDEALPERSRKRGRGGDDGYERERGGKSRRDNQGGRKAGPEAKAEKVDGGGKGADAAQREKDRLAAEARKKRWGT